MKCNLPLNFQAVNFLFLARFRHFAKKNSKIVPGYIVERIFWKTNFQKNRQTSRKKSFENVKIFGGFGQISSFLFSEVAIFSS
jgi:hypothetical protein